MFYRDESDIMLQIDYHIWTSKRLLLKSLFRSCHINSVREQHFGDTNNRLKDRKQRAGFLLYKKKRWLLRTLQDLRRIVLQESSNNSKAEEWEASLALQHYTNILWYRATEQKNTDKTLMRAKPANQEPKRRCVGRTGTRLGWCRSSAEQDLAGACFPHHTAPLTFLLMCSRRCSWPCRKQRCWNSVSSRSGLTSPPCSMFTTFLKPSAQTGHGWWANRTQHSFHLPPSPLLRAFLITLHTFWAASAHTWTCFWAISTRNPGQGRALEDPTGHPCCSLCRESLSTMGTLVCQELKCQLLGNSCLKLQATRIQGKVFQKHRPPTSATFGKKGHAHIWKSALSTSWKSSKGF